MLLASEQSYQPGFVCLDAVVSPPRNSLAIHIVTVLSFAGHGSLLELLSSLPSAIIAQRQPQIIAEWCKSNFIYMNQWQR